MAVLFDPADEYVCSVLELAKVHGEISLADLESIIKKAGVTPQENDIADTIDALAAMGVEIELVSAIRRRARTPLEILPQLTAAAGRKIPLKRTWIQNVFPRLAPQTSPPPGEGLSRHSQHRETGRRGPSEQGAESR